MIFSGVLFCNSFGPQVNWLTAQKKTNQTGEWRLRDRFDRLPIGMLSYAACDTHFLYLIVLEMLRVLPDELVIEMVGETTKSIAKSLHDPYQSQSTAFAIDKTGSLHEAVSGKLREDRFIPKPPSLECDIQPFQYGGVMLG